MTLTVSGIEYAESDVAHVWDQIAQTASVATESVLTRAHIAGRSSIIPRRIHQGDTLPPVLVAGRDLAGRAISIGTGWTCTGRVVDARWNEVVAPREIVETAVAGGVTCFVARLTSDESDTLDPPDFAEYRWLVEIASPDRSFVDTVETVFTAVAD